MHDRACTHCTLLSHRCQAMLFSIRRKDGGEDSRQLEFLCRVLFAMRHSVVDLGHVLRAAKDAQDGPLVMDSTGAETQTSRLTIKIDHIHHFCFVLPRMCMQKVLVG